MIKVGILDYGVGNIGSVFRAIQDLGAIPVVVSDPTTTARVDRIILPGVGNFTECMRILEGEGWTDLLQELVEIKRLPVLGICLGMQLLADYGEEGASSSGPTRGLGLLPGRVVSMRGLGCTGRLPHVGWNSIFIPRATPLLDGLKSGTDFYFVHSFTFVAHDASDVLATVRYGEDFTAIVGRGSVHGVQFHPEKSSNAGMRVLRNFLEGVGC